jgi:hypothetical protein
MVLQPGPARRIIQLAVKRRGAEARVTS